MNLHPRALARKIRDWDNSFWRYEDTEGVSKGYLHQLRDRPFSRHRAEGISDPPAKALLSCGETIQTEYLFHYDGPATLEPTRGWAISNRNRLIWESLPYSQADGLPKPSFYLHRALPRKVVKISEVISSRYWLGNKRHQ